MQTVFDSALQETQKDSAFGLVTFIWREVSDWPFAVLQEHLRSRKGLGVTQNNLAWKPLTSKELILGLVLFGMPILSDLIKLVFGYQIGNRIGSFLLLSTLIFILAILIFGLFKGFPRWTVPCFGALVITLVMLQAVFPLWGLFAEDVRQLIHYSTKTLAARIQYSVLLGNFFWLISFTVLVLLVIFLMIWPRTRKLAHRIRLDWTLMSLMVYSALVFNLELIFEEYAYDEAWKIASRICLFIGAWIYFTKEDQRKRILALLVGTTFFFGIAAVGQGVVLPQQSWGAFYGYDHWTYRRVILSSTLTGWVSALFFMMVPALINLLPGSKQVTPKPEKAST
jgi:hypothetical protein